MPTCLRPADPCIGIPIAIRCAILRDTQGPGRWYKSATAWPDSAAVIDNVSLLSIFGALLRSWDEGLVGARR